MTKPTAPDPVDHLPLASGSDGADPWGPRLARYPSVLSSLESIARELGVVPEARLPLASESDVADPRGPRLARYRALPPLSGAGAERAVERTSSVLSSLESIRRALGMPPEALGAIFEVYVAAAGDVSAGVPPLHDDDAAKVAGRVSSVLSSVEAIRRQLDAPPAALGAIFRVYVAAERDVRRAELRADDDARRAEAAARSLRLPITMTTRSAGQPGGAPFRPGEVRWVTVRPQLPFRAEEFEIVGDPALWLVHDIQVGVASILDEMKGEMATCPSGGRSQTASSSTIDGSQFRKGGLMSRVKFDVCEVGMDIAAIVEYGGPPGTTADFEMTIVGTAWA